MRLIDADALLEKIDAERDMLVADDRLGTEHILVHYVREFIEDAPTVCDIVRCLECKNGSTWYRHRVKCKRLGMIFDELFWCGYGEREEDA